MARVDDLVLAALKTLPPKPGDDASQQVKKRYSELMSAALAVALQAAGLIARPGCAASRRGSWRRTTGRDR